MAGESDNHVVYRSTTLGLFGIENAVAPLANAHRSSREVGVLKSYALLTLLALPSIVSAQEIGTRDRRANIESEVALLKHHPWAGKYSDNQRGTDTGPSFIWLAPKRGAAYLATGWATTTDFGTVSSKGRQLVIDWEKPSRTGRSPTEREMIVIQFRYTVYLVPKSQLHPFCLAARGKGEFPLGLYQRSLTQELQPQERAVPDLPREYRVYLELPRIEAEVVSAATQTRKHAADDEDKISQTVTLGVGSKHHVFSGMRFQPAGTDTPFPLLTIKNVRKNDCDAEYVYYVVSGKSIPAVSQGQEFVTSRW